MAHKTYRTISMNRDLDKRLMDRAQREKQSASSLVRTAVEKHLFQSQENGMAKLKADAISAG